MDDGRWTGRRSYTVTLESDICLTWAGITTPGLMCPYLFKSKYIQKGNAEEEDVLTKDTWNPANATRSF